MNEKEIRDRFEGKKCETQMEFDRVMSEMNEVQAKLNHPYDDELREVNTQRRLIVAQIHALKIQLDTLRVRGYEVEQKKKDINRTFNELKHELVMLNPREQFQKTETNKSEE